MHWRRKDKGRVRNKALVDTNTNVSASSSPGVVALLSSLGAAPWLWRQRWAGLWHCSVPASDEP